MYYGAIKNYDIANGTGVRVSLFVSGCTNRCEGCFQPETWDFKYGRPFTEQTRRQIMQMLSPPYIAGLTVLGGDPFEPSNQIGLIELLRGVKSKMPSKTIWMYTGYTYENLPQTEVTQEIISLADVLVDGRFEMDEKDIGLRFRGSRNQRVIDLNRTQKCGIVTLVEGV